MFCPIRAAGIQDSTPTNSHCECVNKECALWDSFLEQCSVLTIAKMLYKIKVNINK